VDGRFGDSALAEVWMASGKIAAVESVFHYLPDFRGIRFSVQGLWPELANVLVIEWAAIRADFYAAHQRAVE
jgi:hypothetical protein